MNKRKNIADDPDVDQEKGVNDHLEELNAENSEPLKNVKDLEVQNVSENDDVVLSQELEKMKNQLLQAQADFDNYRKRVAREQAEIRQYASSKFIEALLPILDNFELGLKSTQENEQLTAGFQMVFSQLQTLLTDKRVTEIVTEHIEFDPQQEEAMAYVHDEEIPEGHIVQTVRKGYKLHNKLLRPASVIVSKGKEVE